MSDSYNYDDILLEKRIEEDLKKKRSVFEHGDHAPAFRRDLSNIEMLQLRLKGYSYRRIGEVLGCSPNTVKNRLKGNGLLKLVGKQ